MILDYCKQFTDQDVLLENEIRHLDDKAFLISEKQSALITKRTTYAGEFLGITHNNKFVPGVALLERIKHKTSQWVIVDAKAEWLVVCGRDVWGPSILETGTNLSPDMRVLVLSREKEVLGVGRIVEPNLKKKGVAIKMQFDIGDFIRRGKKILQKRE